MQPDGKQYEVLKVDIPSEYLGRLSITGQICCRTEPDRSISKPIMNALDVLVSPYELPGLADWYHGDFYYSWQTAVEGRSGVPIRATACLGTALGLSWSVSLYKPSSLRKEIVAREWDLLLDEITAASEDHPPYPSLIGEQILCTNAQGKEIELLALGLQDPLYNRGELTTILAEINGQGGLSFALGPYTRRRSFWKRLLGKQGIWETRDFEQPELLGLKIVNGPTPSTDDDEFYEGRSKWIALLRDGVRSRVLGGSDALCRQTYPAEEPRNSLPHGHGAEKSTFGAVRTVAYCPNGFSRDHVLEALGEGRFIVTEGPFVSFSLLNERNEETTVGGSITGSSLRMSLVARSSSEFGDFALVMVILGDLDMHEEDMLFAVFKGTYKDMQNIEIVDEMLPPTRRGYIRVEAETELDGRIFFAFTNPIWFETTEIE
jgi:hypothetical protein